MGEETLQIALIKYNKKTWCKSGLLGFLIGLAIIVPGISGSTVAIIFKLYDQFLYAVGNLFKKFKQCFAFLLPIGLGMVLGVLLGFISVQKLLDLIPFAVVGLFAGLMVGAFPAVKDELKGAEMNFKRIALLAAGVSLPIAVGCFSALFGGASEGADVFAEIPVWYFPLALVVGYAVGVTQIVPGLSASAILMAIGWFTSLMNSVSMTYWSQNPAVWGIYVGLAVGFLLGMFTFSKLLTYVFSKARYTAYSLIVGLSLGSVLSMFCNGDIVAVYASWVKNGVSWLDVGLGAALFIVGVIAAYLLVRYQRKKDAENAENAKNAENEGTSEIQK